MLPATCNKSTEVELHIDMKQKRVKLLLSNFLRLIFTSLQTTSRTQSCKWEVTSGHTPVFFFTADAKELYCSKSAQLLRLRLSCQELQTASILISGVKRGDPKQTPAELTHVFIKRSEATGERRHASVDSTAVFSASAGRPGGERCCVLMGLSLIAS